MENQVLSIEQMKRLKELGVDTSKASMCYISKYTSCDFDDGDEIVVVCNDFNKKLHNEFGPAFTLQDIIELLPKQLPPDDFGYNCLLITPNVGLNGYVFHYEDNADGEIYKQIYSEDILQSAYEMLIWVVENGYLKTKVYEKSST